MNARDAIRNTIDMSAMVIDSYTKDLSDSELLLRPVPGMNHIAWQLGHLISSERGILDMVRPGSSPALPEGFEATYARDQTSVDDPSKFLSVAHYQELWKAQRKATLEVLDSLSDADLDQTNEKFPPFAPTVGAVMNLIGNHPTMHAGQFVAVRRQLDKPIAI